MVRIFWIAIAILIAATAAAFLYPSEDPATATLTSDQTQTPQPEPTPNHTYADGAPSASTPPTDTDESAPQLDPTPPTNEPVPQPNAQLDTTPAPTDPNPINPPSAMPYPEEDQPNADKTETSKPDAGPGEPIASRTAPVIEQDPADNDTTPIPEPIPEPNPEPEPEPTPEPQTETAREMAPEPADNSIQDEEVASPAAAEPQQAPPPIAVTPRAKPTPTPEPTKPAATPVVTTDKGLLLDGRWEIEGKGTKDAPYAIEWDMLVALQRDYQPRLGQTEIPEWIQALNGKTVTIRGYALLPMGMSSLSELLVMLNQWDSCCIGVPPTPYDAIEVRLAENLSNTAQSMFSHTGALSYGDITGTFKIDPYIVQGYLLGLYLMEDAKANLLGPAGTP